MKEIFSTTLIFVSIELSLCDTFHQDQPRDLRFVFRAKKIRAIADSSLALQAGIEGQASLRKFIRAARCHVNFGNLQLGDAGAASVRVQRSDDGTACEGRGSTYRSVLGSVLLRESDVSL